jgi:hypothetical protein
MTQDEVLYSFGGASTNLATFTTEDNLLKTYPPIAMPSLSQLLANVGSRSSSLKIRACGQAGSTATPTYTFSLRLCTSSTFSTGGLLLGASNAITTGSGITLAPWQLDVDIVLRSIAAAGSATTSVVTMGTVTGLAFPTAGGVPASGTSPVLATVNLDTPYWLFLSAACSASSASNLINTQMFKLYGEN